MSNILPLKTIAIPAGESLFVELGAMEAYSDKKITMSTGFQTSLCTAASRKFFGGENLLLNKFSASAKEAGWIALEEANPGQLVEHTLSPSEQIIMKKGAFVACDSNVNVSASITGIHGHLAKVGLLVLQAQTTNHKTGRVFFSSGEGIVKKLEITDSNDSVAVDNNNILAYTGSLKLSTTAPGGPFSWYYGGEGIVTRFSGKGTIYIGAPKTTSDLNIARAEQAALRAEKAKEEMEKIAKEFFEANQRLRR